MCILLLGAVIAYQYVVLRTTLKHWSIVNDVDVRLFYSGFRCGWYLSVVLAYVTAVKKTHNKTAVCCLFVFLVKE